MHRENTVPHYLCYMEIDRAQWHDYREPRIYLLTLTVSDREAKPFGTLVGHDEGSASIALTALGKALQNEICDQPRRHPQLALIDYVVMEDHCHILIDVKQTLPDHLGKVVWGIKYGTTVAYLNALSKQCGCICRVAGSRPSLDARSRMAKGAVQGTDVPSGQENIRYVSPLWASGYHDRILSKRGQLSLLKRYVLRNPARLWAKRHSNQWNMKVSDGFLPLPVVEAQRLKDFALYCDEHRGLRTQSALRVSYRGNYATTHLDLLAKTLVVRPIQNDRIVGLKFRMCGNSSLLDSGRPLVRVRISRSVTKEQFEREVDRLLTLCEHEGAILVSPFISWSEKMVLRLARHNHYPHIVVDPSSMSSLYKLSDTTRSFAQQQLPLWWEGSATAAIIARTAERSDMQCGIAGELLVITPWFDRPHSDHNGKAEMELMNEICATLANRTLP